MKNKNFFILSVLSVLLATNSCSNLDRPLENTVVSSSTDYTVMADMIKPTIGLYAQVYNFDWAFYALVHVLGDDVNSGGLGDQPGFYATDRYTYDAGYWMYNTAWNAFSKNILVAHQAMEQTELYKAKATGDDIKRANQYIAEAKVLRAWNLLIMARLWGAVYVTTSSNPLELYNSTPTKKDDVMTHISNQMDEAVMDLPDLHPNQRTDIPGGVTKYTALAIKALANLELKNYTKVAEATGQIIASNKFQLDQTFSNLFGKNGKLNNEMLFELQYSDLGANSGTNSYVGSWDFFGPQDWEPKVAGSSGGWGFYEPSMKYIKFMLARGEKTRLQQSVIFTPAGVKALQDGGTTIPSWLTSSISTITHSDKSVSAYTAPWGDKFVDFPRALFLSGKHSQPSTELNAGHTGWCSNKNRSVIRYAEILLMYAEALTNGASGSAGTAADAINKLRARAGLANIATPSADDVVNEKYAELAMEWGTRFYDMRRLNKSNELSYDGRTFDPAKNNFLPYPQGQVDQLPVLKTTVQQ